MCKIVRNKIIPFKGFVAINLFGIIFTREKEVSETTLNHEKIHTAQWLEITILLMPSVLILMCFGYSSLLLIIPPLAFYFLYLLEWLIKLIFYREDAYYHISFEVEAYKHQYINRYTKKNRKPFKFLKYILTNKFSS